MFVADLHNDLVQRMMIGEDVTQNTSSGHTDIERLKLSSIDLEVMIVWASEKEDNISYFDFALSIADELKCRRSLVKKYSLSEHNFKYKLQKYSSLLEE